MPRWLRGGSFFSATCVLPLKNRVKTCRENPRENRSWNQKKVGTSAAPQLARGWL